MERNTTKNYTEIIDKLLLNNSLTNKIYLCNDETLTSDSECVFDLNNTEHRKWFVNYYGIQSLIYHEKINQYWFGGEVYYDNIKCKNNNMVAEIKPLTIDDINVLLYNYLYAEINHLGYERTITSYFFKEHCNIEYLKKEFFKSNKEMLLEEINQTIKENYVSFEEIKWNIVSANANINILTSCVDYLNWINVRQNRNLTKEFILEHIDKFDIIDLISYQVVNCHPTWVADVIATLPYKIDEQQLTYSIINTINGLGWTIEDADLLCVIDYIDWDIIFKECYFDYDFVVKYNKYWNKDNKIVKSILENHTINTNKKYILVSSDLVVNYVGNTYEETFNYLCKEINEIYSYYIQTADYPISTQDIMKRYMRNKFHFLDNDNKEDIVEFKINEIEIPHQ